MEWEKTGRVVKSNGESTVTYSNGQGTTIESRKRHVPHANGVGYWTHTTYWVLVDGVEVVEKYSLKDAKEFVEQNEEASK